MTDEGEGAALRPLEPGQLKLLRIHALIASAFLALAAIVAEVALNVVPLPPGLVAAPVLLIILYLNLRMPSRHYRAWGYNMDAEELQVRHGVLTQVHVVVPLRRVQHIDLSQGPLERACRVCRLLVHTAGTMHSRVVLPGLSRENAERMRDEIRARIRQEPE
jgi:membrane protein YdbS with pleckstrin-like domain